MTRRQMLGCVADDFTGASDAASFLQKAGMRTLLLNEVQEKITALEQIDAVVIALKSRTQETEAAVKEPAGSPVARGTGGVKVLF